MRRAPLSAWETTYGTKTEVCIYAELLRSNLGALEPPAVSLQPQGGTRELL